MTLDRCLPQFLLRVNRRGASHRIIIGFFLLGVSVLLITRGELEALAGVYTISFLAVMALFGIGNVLLKVKRARLPRPVRASWTAVIAGIAAVLVGLVGQVAMNPSYTRVFLIYFLPTVLVVVIMLGRIALLKACLFFIQGVSETIAGVTNSLSETIRTRIERISGQQMVFFTRGDHIAHLNDVMLYVRRNEHTNRIKVVTVVEKAGEVLPKLEEDLKFLDAAYPEIDIEFVVIEGIFRSALIQELSAKWGIPVFGVNHISRRIDSPKIELLSDCCLIKNRTR